MRALRPLLISAAAAILSLLLIPGAAFAQGEDSPSPEEALQMETSLAQQETTVEEEEEVRVRVEVQERETEPERVVVQPRVADPPHWMWIVGRSAIWGGIIGGLLGFGTWLVTGLEWSPWVIAQFAGGGILAGAAIGLLEATIWTEEAYGFEQPASLQWIEGQAPETFDLQLLKIHF